MRSLTFTVFPAALPFSEVLLSSTMVVVLGRATRLRSPRPRGTSPKGTQGASARSPPTTAKSVRNLRLDLLRRGRRQAGTVAAEAVRAVGRCCWSLFRHLDRKPPRFQVGPRPPCEPHRPAPDSYVGVVKCRQYGLAGFNHTPKAFLSLSRFTLDRIMLKFYYPSIRESAPSNESAEGLRRRRLGHSVDHHHSCHLRGILPVRATARPTRAARARRLHPLRPLGARLRAASPSG